MRADANSKSDGNGNRSQQGQTHYSETCAAVEQARILTTKLLFCKLAMSEALQLQYKIIVQIKDCTLELVSNHMAQY